MRLLDLFCGRFGWSRAFAARGWECVGVDLVEPLEIPTFVAPGKIDFIQCDVRDLSDEWIRFGKFNFVCASSPCEKFSIHGMRHFYPDPPYPTMGIELFNRALSLCEASGLPYVMENVRAAQQFVGNAVHHCGPFYLWGTGVPAIMPQGLNKGFTHDGMRDRVAGTRRESIAAVATIPAELSACVADYAERLIEQASARTQVSA